MFSRDQIYSENGLITLNSLPTTAERVNLLMHPFPFFERLDYEFEIGMYTTMREHPSVVFVDLHSLEENPIFYDTLIKNAPPSLLAVVVTEPCRSHLLGMNYTQFGGILTRVFPAERYVMGGQEIYIQKEISGLHGCVTGLFDLYPDLDVVLDLNLCGFPTHTEDEGNMTWSNLHEAVQEDIVRRLGWREIPFIQ
jgi:hypothetical protein